MPFLSIPDGRIVSGNGKGKKLTAKMLEFIDLYMIHMNATKAMELSSYNTKIPGRQAMDLMQHPLVLAEIDRRLKLRSDKSEVKAEYLIQKLLNIIEDGGIKTADQLRAIELAGKSIALWKERQEISGVDGAAIQHEQRVTEAADAFTQKLKQLGKREATNNSVVIPFKPIDE